MPEISIKCVNCRWIGTSKTKKSKYVCESCGSEAEEVPEVVKKEEPQPAEPVIRITDLSSRRKKAILKLRKFVLDLFSLRFDAISRTQSVGRSGNLTTEQIKLSLLAELEGALYSGKLDSAICPMTGDGSKVTSFFINLLNKYSYYEHNQYELDRVVGEACISYHNYCTNPDIIEEE